MKFILARKVEMTRVFGEDGRVRAATVLSATPVTVTQVKSKDSKDGYQAVQVATGERRAKNISKAVLGHTKGIGYKAIREFRIPEGDVVSSELAVGSSVDVSAFAIGDRVRVSGLTKGRGVAGGGAGGWPRVSAWLAGWARTALRSRTCACSP